MPSDKRKLYIMIGIWVSLVVVIFSALLVSQRTRWFGRAQTTSMSSLLSLENSYLFASPISALADGTSIIRVTVFLLNSQGLGISGQKVTLKILGAVTVGEVSPVTDTFGRAIFDLTASTPGVHILTAEVAGAILSQKVQVEFR